MCACWPHRGRSRRARTSNSAILAHLVDDLDPEIRATADSTLSQIPAAALISFLARSDVPIGLREFFADRGVFPDLVPSIAPPVEPDAPLLEATGTEAVALAEESDAPKGMAQRISEMSVPARLQAAIKGTREMRALLIRDTNRMVAAAVLSSPRLNDAEMEAFARMANVGEDVLRVIGGNRAWTKNYTMLSALTKNPKTPIATSLNLMPG